MNKKLSLCMIVRDEEDNLAVCLDSVAKHVDEIIIVDTGSVDRTREVAVRYGASVYQFDPHNHPEAFFRDTAEENARWAGPGEYSGMWCLADFAAARNESFKHATGDYIVWMDADDVLDGAENLRHVVAHLEATSQPMGYLAYNYAQDDKGRVHYRQWRERVIRRGTAYWLNPVHEVLMPISVPTKQPDQYETPIYIHRRKADRKQVPHRNYKILLRQTQQLKAANPAAELDPRILFYLGQEARFVEPRRALGFYEEYLERSGWPEERAAAHMAIGNMLEFNAFQLPPAQALAKAKLEYAAATVEMPNNPDGLFSLARIAQIRQQWFDCIRFNELGFQVGNTDTMLGTNPQARLYMPHFSYNYALGKLGRVEEALKSCNAGLAAMPDDPGIFGAPSGMLTLNKRVYEDELRARQERKPVQQEPKLITNLTLEDDLDAPPHPGIKPDAVLVWATQIWKQLVAAGDGKKAAALLESLPSTVTSHPVFHEMVRKTSARFAGAPAPVPVPAQPDWRGAVSSLFGSGERAFMGMESGCVDFRSHVPPNGKDIVFYLGAGPEPWDPRTPATKGLGGSETAAIEVAKNLAALGHRCVVYAEASGTFDAVEYRHHSAFKGATCDVFIASRAPWAAEQHGPVDAKLKLLWVHDVHCGPPSPQMERWFHVFDRVLCLSEWHKQFFASCYPTLHPDKIIVTRNGIDPARFTSYSADPSAKTNSLVFSSSPNRGLDMLVYNFKNHIRPAVPDAQLHVFYGFDTWETIARMRGAQDELNAIEEFKKILPPLGQERDGIYNHGKRPQQEVAAAYLRAKVWPYLTAFLETSCITAMEAMAAGAVPVCSDLAALRETVGSRGILIKNEGDDQYPRFSGNAWVDNVLRLLRDDATRAPLAAAGRAHALGNLSWTSLAGEWSAMFDRLITELSVDPVPLWRSA